MIQRGVLMSGKSDHITVEHIRNGLFSNLDEEMKKSETGDLPLIPVDEMELILIQKALDKTGGNQKEAAELLGISDRTIRNKLKKLRQQEENSDS
jgi:transcriptional regulator with PAS, ATPase and Fis domain